MKIRHKKSGSIMDVEKILIIGHGDFKIFSITPLPPDRPVMEQLNEEFEDVKKVELPKKIRNVLQDWINLQKREVYQIRYQYMNGCAIFTLVRSMMDDPSQCLELRIDRLPIEERIYKISEFGLVSLYKEDSKTPF